MSETLQRPPRIDAPTHRVAIVFAGGPAVRKRRDLGGGDLGLRNGIDVVGVLNGDRVWWNSTRSGRSTRAATT